MKNGIKKAAGSTNGTAKNKVLQISEKIPDLDDLIELQLFLDEIKNKYGLKIKIDYAKSAYENEVVAQEKCDTFWREIVEHADNFIKMLGEFPNSYTKSEQGEGFSHPANLEYFTKLKVHPFSAILIADTIKKESLDLDGLKNLIMPPDKKDIDGISTAEFAHRIGGKPGSIRVRFCETDSYFGIKPHKLPNGRLLWPADAVQKLIETKKSQKH